MFWVFDVTHIVEVDLDAAVLCATPLVYLSIISDTDETIRIIRVEIGRVAWDLQFSEDSRIARIRESYDKKWIDLLECDEIETISYKTRGLEILSWSDIVEPAYHLTCW